MDDSDRIKLIELLLLSYIAKKVIDAIPPKDWNNLMDSFKKKKKVKGLK